MYLCHCLLPASLYNQASSRPHTMSPRVTLERVQARPKDGTKRSTPETVISPAKPAMAMESRPLPGYHIMNSYWSKPGCWDQNNYKYRAKRFISLSHTHLLSLRRAAIRAISVRSWSMCVCWRGFSYQLPVTWTLRHSEIYNFNHQVIKYNQLKRMQQSL